MSKPRLQNDNLAIFFQAFLKRPHQVGSIIPSSRFLEKRIVHLAGLEGAQVIVELGPGTGGTTRALLGGMRNNAKLLSIEINPGFVAMLREVRDSRLIVHEGDASEVAHAIARHRLRAPDVVISGIPFSTMARDRGEELLHTVFGALAPGGRFVAYQVRDRVESIGRAIFGTPQVEFEFRNIPPMRLYRWDKPANVAEAYSV
jgi:phosphatidylethanolamine/phosphatidyl-N-methylethanolamine N-methyltransferase